MTGERLAAWWRARTRREQLLLKAAGVFMFALLLPAWAYLAAATYREAGAQELARASRIEAQVARLAEAARAEGAPSADPSLRGRALAAAQAGGLSVARVEAAGGERVRIVFEAAESNALYRWIDRIGRGGAFVRRTMIVRVGEGDLVNAEFELAASP